METKHSDLRSSLYLVSRVDGRCEHRDKNGCWWSDFDNKENVFQSLKLGPGKYVFGNNAIRGAYRGVFSGTQERNRCPATRHSRFLLVDDVYL